MLINPVSREEITIALALMLLKADDIGLLDELIGTIEFNARSNGKFTEMNKLLNDAVALMYRDDFHEKVNEFDDSGRLFSVVNTISMNVESGKDVVDAISLKPSIM